MHMIPLWIKISYSTLVAIVVVVYATHYGARNFLWFSDIALIVTVPALWLENQWLASMMAVGVFIPELLWNLSFFGRILIGESFVGLADYMFDRDKPLYLRSLSLFHIILPPLLLWMVSRLGYESGAWIAQTALAWIVLPLTYWLTDPDDNINWVYGLSKQQQERMSPLVYLGMLMIAFPLLVYLPTHLLFMLLLDKLNFLQGFAF